MFYRFAEQIAIAMSFLILFASKTLLQAFFEYLGIIAYFGPTVLVAYLVYRWVCRVYKDNVEDYGKK